LGASTEDAQRNVAIALAEQLVDYLCHGNVSNAVNVPSVSREVLEQLGPWLHLAQKLGRLAGQLCPQALTAVEVEARGDINQYPLKPVTVQALKGILSQTWAEGVNEVSAPALAKEMGIEVVEQRRGEHHDFASSLTLRLKGKTELSIEGTVFGRRHPRVVRVNQFDVEAVPSGHLIAIHNRDVPGVVGRVGTLLGDSAVNIGRIHLSRDREHGEAFSLINVDSPVPQAVLDGLRKLSGVLSVRQLSV
jgi:D-3-phosphoglycerate dehydrogenase/(S)-sulfolactate dehydrogenase